ncbi:hypothetical protein Tco_0167605 [Tanacetum coccineum]
MLVQPTEDEGEASKRQSKPQPTPSPPHPSADQYKTRSDPSPRPSPNRPLSENKDGLTLQSVYDLCVSLCKPVIDQAKEIKHLKAQIKKIKKKAKPVITHHKAWMKSVSMKQRLAGKKSLNTKWMQKYSVVLEEKESTQKGVSTEDPLSTAQLKVTTDKPEVSTDKPKEVEVSTDKLDEGT